MTISDKKRVRKPPALRRTKSHDADRLLVECLDQLVSLLVQVRGGADCGELDTLAKIFLMPRLCRTPVDMDAAIGDAMSDAGRRLAARLPYKTLHNTIEDIAGDPNNPNWGQRFTPLASALDGAITCDGEIWIT